jgi:hypothetical protein
MALPVDRWLLLHGLFAAGWNAKVASSQAVAALCEMEQQEVQGLETGNGSKLIFLFLETLPQS